METAIEVSPQQQSAIRRLIIHGDLSKLTTEQKETYYVMLCDTCNLDWRTRPFDYLKLNGKEVLYANKNCGEQLRQNKKISISLPEKKIEDGVYIVTARAESGGRHDEATGAVSIENLKGEQRANAIMKAETKAKRRVTLSFAGLGMLDETEVDSIQGAEKIVGGSSTAPTAKPETAAAQSAWEREHGIKSEPAKPVEAEVIAHEPTPAQPEKTPEQIAAEEKGRIKNERKKKLPQDIVDYFKAKKFTNGRCFEIMDANEDDPERLRGFMRDNPIEVIPDKLEDLNESMPTAF